MPCLRSTVLFACGASRRLARRPLRAFAQELISQVAPGRACNVLIAGDTALRRLNRQFRGKDYAADVLSFPRKEASGFLGEIAISIDRASEQARQFGHSLEQEVRILMLHGLLHLAGFDHQTDGGRMARAESRWRRRFQLPGSLIERVRR